MARRVAADNVTLNNVLPGMFHTAAVHDQFTANARRNGTSYDIEVAKFVEAYQIPARRFGDPRDIGFAGDLLCSELPDTSPARASWSTAAPRVRRSDP